MSTRVLKLLVPVEDPVSIEPNYAAIGDLHHFPWARDAPERNYMRAADLVRDVFPDGWITHKSWEMDGVAWR